ncbi:MAG: hypothetical protein ACPLGZ_00450, partial [Candidatus Pelagibacter ubique]
GYIPVTNRNLVSVTWWGYIPVTNRNPLLITIGRGDIAYVYRRNPHTNRNQTTHFMKNQSTKY